MCFGDFPIDFHLCKLWEMMLSGCLAFVEPKDILQTDLGLIPYVHYVPMLIDENNKLIIDIEYYNKYLGTEEGFKIQSRELIEADAGESIIQNDVKKQRFDSKDAQTVFNIANAVSTYMGVDVEPFSEFIVRNVLKSQARIMPSREKYEMALNAARAKGKKKLDTYEDAFNQSLILLSLNYLLISVQTSIPNINTKKRHFKSL